SDEEPDHLERVVAYVEQVARGDGSRGGARPGENDSDDDEQRHLQPSESQLGAVQQAEDRAGEEHACQDAVGPRDDRIDIAAEDRFLDQGGEEHGDRHEEHGGGAALENHLDRQGAPRWKGRGSERDKNLQEKAASDVSQPDQRARNRDGPERSPSYGAPEWGTGANSHLRGEIAEENRVEQNLGADGEQGGIFARVLDARGADAEGAEDAHEDHAGDEYSADGDGDEQQQVNPIPGDLQIERDVASARGLGAGCGIRDGGGRCFGGGARVIFVRIHFSPCALAREGAADARSGAGDADSLEGESARARIWPV